MEVVLMCICLLMGKYISILLWYHINMKEKPTSESQEDHNKIIFFVRREILRILMSSI